MSHLEKLAPVISSYAEEIARFTEQLVAIPTENPPGNHLRQCALLLAGKLRDLQIERDVSAGNWPCILAYYGSGEPTLYFHGHYDVVPAQSREQFYPHRRGVNLFGRGSADMKAGLAAMIYAVAAIRQCELPLKGRIALSFVPDEETGGKNGSALLSPQGIGMLTAEPTAGVIWNECRGAISLAVTVKGKTAHVGLERTGVNALEKMLEVAQGLLDRKRELAPRGSILMLGGECRSGSGFNAVPASCRFTVDRRINPDENLAAEQERLIELLDIFRQRGIDLEYEILQLGEPARTEATAPLSRALAESIEEVTGKPAVFEMCPGLLDTRFYNSRGIPALAYGPGMLSVSHGPNEFVSLKSVEACALVYALTALRLLS